MKDRTRSALRCSALCFVTLTLASFACGVVIALVDPAKSPVLASGLAFALLGALLFAGPTAIISGIMVWVRRPSSACEPKA